MLDICKDSLGNVQLHNVAEKKVIRKKYVKMFEMYKFHNVTCFFYLTLQNISVHNTKKLQGAYVTKRSELQNVFLLNVKVSERR
jgi:hypothetical protein